jgi:hypothetical protein
VRSMMGLLLRMGATITRPRAGEIKLAWAGLDSNQQPRDYEADRHKSRQLIAALHRNIS